jgi:SAM-dependent methyltransferase
MNVPYGGRLADLYDIFYEDKPYASEVEWIHEHLSASSPTPHRILDVACGTGRHSIELAGLGYEVVGVDLSKEMILKAQERAKETPRNPTFLVQDMRGLGFPQASFDAVVCLFDSIGYAQSDPGVQAALESISGVLKPQGLFVFEFWHETAMVKGYDPVRVRRWEAADRRVIRISETTLDLGKRLAEVAYTVIEIGSDGATSAFEEVHLNRFFSVPDMESFVVGAGLKPLHWFSGYSDDLVAGDTFHVVGIARKP